MPCVSKPGQEGRESGEYEGGFAREVGSGDSGGWDEGVEEEL